MSDQFESLFPDRFKHDLHSPPMGEQDKARKMAEQVSIEIAKHFFYRGKTMEKATAPLITNALLHFAQERESEAVRELCEALEPFALMAEIETAMTQNGSVPPTEHSTIVIKLAPCRKAAAVLAKHSKKGAKDE